MFSLRSLSLLPGITGQGCAPGISFSYSACSSASKRCASSLPTHLWRGRSNDDIRGLSTLSSSSPLKFKTWPSIYQTAVEGAGLSNGLGLVRALSGGNETEMHSEKLVWNSTTVKVIGIPALADNFMYLVIDKASWKGVVIDPVEPEKVMDEIEKEKMELVAILTTHHHPDHAGGNEKMVKLYKAANNVELEVYGGAEQEPILGLTKKIGQDDKIDFGSLAFECCLTPGHTPGHICYVLKSQYPMQKPMVFTGDTLVIGGCGGLVEGTAEEMYVSLIKKLGKLPADTLVFCGRDITVSNLKFALAVEPENVRIQKKLEWAEQQRSKRLPTIPSSIGEEKRTNPFMRCILPEVRSAVNASSPQECVTFLKNMKDRRDNKTIT